MQYPEWIHCCIQPNYNFSVLQSSVATVLRWGDQNYSHLRRVSFDVTCQKWLKSANVSRSYSKFSVTFLWNTVYISSLLLFIFALLVCNLTYSIMCTFVACMTWFFDIIYRLYLVWGGGGSIFQWYTYYASPCQIVSVPVLLMFSQNFITLLRHTWLEAMPVWCVAHSLKQQILLVSCVHIFPMISIHCPVVQDYMCTIPDFIIRLYFSNGRAVVMVVVRPSLCLSRMYCG